MRPAALLALLALPAPAAAQTGPMETLLAQEAQGFCEATSELTLAAAEESTSGLSFAIREIARRADFIASLSRSVDKIGAARAAHDRLRLVFARIADCHRRATVVGEAGWSLAAPGSRMIPREEWDDALADLETEIATRLAETP